MINKFSEETAIGIVTCDRPDFLFKLLDSIDSSAGSIFVINAGGNLGVSDDFLIEKYNLAKIIHTTNSPEPVGRAKNKVLREMRHSGYSYLFLIEDDIEIIDNSVFELYIKTAADSGLWAGQLSYGIHGGIAGGNLKSDGSPNIITTVEYDKTSVDVYPQSFQAFTLYHANVIKIIGYFDDMYVNAAEHLDHYYLAFNKGLGSYFWAFPDVKDSYMYIKDIDDNHSKSVIRSNPDWKNNVKKAWGIFKAKYGFFPTDIKKPTEKEVIDRFNFIETNYSRKELIE